MARLILLDGTLIRGVADPSQLVCDSRTQSIYADLGPEASQVGPILIPAAADCFLSDETLSRSSATIRRNWRDGRAILDTEADAMTLARHLREQRHLKTHDGLRFFFRYADARAMLSVWAVLTEAQRVSLLGPITKWTLCDAAGEPTVLETPGAAPSTWRPLVLSQPAIDRLGESMETRSLLAAAEEVDPSLAERETDAEALSWCEQAARLARQSPKCSFATETLVAVALARSKGRALESATFQIAFESARRAEKPTALQDWIDMEAVAAGTAP